MANNCWYQTVAVHLPLDWQPPLPSVPNHRGVLQSLAVSGTLLKPLLNAAAENMFDAGHPYASKSEVVFPE